MRVLMSLSFCAALAGCAWPIMPTFDVEQQVKGTKTLHQMDQYEARSLLANWHDTLESAANNRRNAELVMAELTFYGTLVFTGALAHIASAGGAAQVSKDVLRARNIGATAAGGSQLLSSHYNWPAQRVAFSKAANRLQCASRAMAPLNPALRDVVMNPTYIDNLTAELKKKDPPTTFEELWSKIPEQTLHFVESQVNPDLQASLQAITLSTPSQTELTTLIDSWRSARKTGADVASTADGARVSEQRLSKIRSTVPVLNVVNGSTKEPETRPRTPQREKDAEAIKDRSAVELEDMQKAFVIALVEYGSALALCK